MQFWDYVETEEANEIKKKGRTCKDVPKSHWIYRNYLGAVDQSDVKSFVMGLCRERVAKWGHKQLAYLVEAAIICSNGNFNLEPRFNPQSFIDYDNDLITEFLTLSKNYRR